MKKLVLLPFSILIAFHDQEKSVEEATAAGLKYLIDTEKSDRKLAAWFPLAFLAYKCNAGLEKKPAGLADAVEKAKQNLLESTKGIESWKASFTILSCLLLQKEKESNEIKDKIKKLVELLESKRGRNGGWIYAGAIEASFLSATCLIALLEAKNGGFDVSDKTIGQAVDFLKKVQRENNTFGYLLKGDETDGLVGSCARNPICELALYLAGESDQKKLQWAISNFFQNRHELDKVRQIGAKKFTKAHIGKEGTGPHYFFFSHLTVAQALHYVDPKCQIQIDDKGTVKSPAECMELLKKFMIEIQDKDGSWVDTPVWGAQYGTAAALLVLSGQKLTNSPHPKEK